MQDSGKLREITLKGWFLRWEPLKDGMRLVHVSDPTANRMAPGSTGGRRKRVYEVEDPTEAMREAVNADSPIVRRTPQERLASMTAKLSAGETGQDAAARMLLDMLSGRGDIDGLDDDAVKDITGASWKRGDPLDGDTVRRVAARYLGEAERKVAEDIRQAAGKSARKARREQERLEASERRKYERRKKALEANNENTKTIF